MGQLPTDTNMLVVPGGPAQAQFWLDQEKKRRRFERLKESRQTNKIDILRKKLERQAIVELKNTRKAQLRSEIKSQIEELIEYRNRLFENFGNFHLSAVKVQKEYEGKKLNEAKSTDNVKKIIKKTHKEFRDNKNKEIILKKSLKERLNFLSNIEKYRAQAQARKGRIKLENIALSKKPIELPKKYTSIVIPVSPEVSNLKDNAQILVNSLSKKEQGSKLNQVLYQKNRIKRGNDALKYIRRQKQCDQMVEELEKHAKHELYQKKMKFHAMPTPKKSFANVSFEPLPEKSVLDSLVEENPIVTNQIVDCDDGTEIADSISEANEVNFVSSVKDHFETEIDKISQQSPVEIFEKPIAASCSAPQADSGICVTKSSNLNAIIEKNDDFLTNDDHQKEKEEVKNIIKILQKQISDSKRSLVLSTENDSKEIQTARDDSNIKLKDVQLNTSINDTSAPQKIYPHIRRPSFARNQDVDTIIEPISNLNDDSLSMPNIHNLSITSQQLVDSSSHKSHSNENQLIESNDVMISELNLQPVKINEELIKLQSTIHAQLAVADLPTENLPSQSSEMQVEDFGNLSTAKYSLHSIPSNELNESNFFDITARKSNQSLSISGISMPESTSFLLDAYRKSSSKQSPWTTPSKLSIASQNSTNNSKPSRRLSQLLDNFNRRKSQNSSRSPQVTEKIENVATEPEIKIISQQLSDSKFANEDRFFSSSEEEMIISNIDLRLEEYMVQKERQPKNDAD